MKKQPPAADLVGRPISTASALSRTVAMDAFVESLEVVERMWVSDAEDGSTLQPFLDSSTSSNALSASETNSEMELLFRRTRTWSAISR